ncbi:MAG: NAD(P)H-dependent oxidoreductase [Spirochaetales bacterium]|nr:NAD(P)H-dependent oxidoreductase [Spirochaetales bacterium]
MSTPKIAIIISSTRDARFGEKPARYLLEAAQKRSDVSFEIVDLRDFSLPFFNEVASNLWAPTQDPAGQKWQRKIAEFDGFVFVVAEYNHSLTAAMKNAMDFAYPEWNKKAAAFFGYGSVGGARAVEHLRMICVEVQLHPTRNAVHIGGSDFFGVWQQGKAIEDIPNLSNSVTQMLDELVWWTSALKEARTK